MEPFLEHHECQLHSRIRETPIAIVGMACLMPGARSLAEYWENIVRKANSITEVPPDRWDVDAYFDPDPRAPDKTYCKHGGFIPSVEFDPLAWGLPPKILEATDTSQLLSLVVAKDCLEDAGVPDGADAVRDRIGIVLGVAGAQKLCLTTMGRLQYPIVERVLRHHGLPETTVQVIVESYKAHFPALEENTFPGSLGNVIAGRIANRLNLGGLSAVTDAACASSLSAVRMAVHELLEGHSDLMLTGGVCTDNSVHMYMSFSKTPALTADGRCRPLDAASSGMLVGEGIGMVALKRLPDAERDGDRIYAVLRGVGASSDGRSKSIYAPHAEGQAEALRRAYADAGFDLSTNGLLEAHGTGTPAGDVAEAQGLRLALGALHGVEHPMALGSVKSQIGHLKAAAGVAGLIKAALALHHKVLPPTIHVDEPNPRMKLEGSPLYVNSQLRPWPRRADLTPRRAGVSAFGFGGTNFHVALEEHRPHAEGRYRLHASGHVVLLQAAQPSELAGLCVRLREELGAVRNPFELAAALRPYAPDAVPTSHVRAAFVAGDALEAMDHLATLASLLAEPGAPDRWQSPKGAWYAARGATSHGKVAALFPGQGSEYVNMGVELACGFPELLHAVEQADAACHRQGLGAVSARMYPPPSLDAHGRQSEESKLRQTEWAQPALAAVSVGLYTILRSAGFRPDCVGGHSFGDFAALWAAGGLDEATLFDLAVARGQAMKPAADLDPGAMLSVVGDTEQVAALVQEHPPARIASENSSRQVVVAGPTEPLMACKRALKDAGHKVLELRVSAAFHTPLMEGACNRFAAALERAELRRPSLPVYVGGVGEAAPSDPAALRALMAEQMVRPVPFRERVENMYRAGVRIFVEIGPKPVLSKLVSETLGERDHIVVPLNVPNRPADVQLKMAIAQLAVAGLDLRGFEDHLALGKAPHTWDASPLRLELTAANHVGEAVRMARAASRAPAAPADPTASSAPAGSPAKGPETGQAAANGAPQNERLRTTEEGTMLGDQRGGGPRRPPVQLATAAARAEEPVLEGGEHRERLDSDTQRLGTQAYAEPGPVAAFCAWKEQAARAQAEFLRGANDFNHAYLRLLERQLDLAASRRDLALPFSLERGLDVLHEQQRRALSAHEAFLSHQECAGHDTLRLLERGSPGQARAPLSRAGDGAAERADVTPATPPAPPLSASPLRQSLPSPRTRAPLKREIVISARRTAPAHASPDVSALPSADRSAPSTAQLEAGVLEIVHEETGSPPSFGMDIQADLGSDSRKRAREVASLGSSILEIVAEKTGYPIDMLQLSMRVEADLGIDSIKRVEILEAIQERHPYLPEMDPLELGELSTLDEMAAYLEGLLAPPPTPSVSMANLAPDGGAQDAPEPMARKKKKAAKTPGQPPASSA